MRSLTILGITTLLMLPASMSGQSLADLAKKERERREGSSQPAAVVVDDTDLQEYNQGSSSQPETDPSPKGKPEPTKSTSGSSLTPAGSGSRSTGPRSVKSKPKTKAELRDEKTACYERLSEARGELKLAQEKLRKRLPILVESTAKVGTWLPTGGGGGEYVFPPDNGEPVYYEQGKVSCVMAIRNRERYPTQASRCDGIQRRISALRAEIANGCDAPK